VSSPNFFCFFFVPRGSQNSPEDVHTEISIDLVSPMMSLDHHQHFVLENKIFESVSLHYTLTQTHLHTDSVTRASSHVF
jgi:hypothetical protein